MSANNIIIENDVKEAQQEASSLDDACDDRMIALSTNDSSCIESVKVKYTVLSKLITAALENDDQAIELPLPYIKNAAHLRFVVEFFDLCKGVALPDIPKPVKSSKLEENVEQKYADYVLRIVTEYGMPFLYELINIANYLQCDSLLMLCCAQVACFVKSKSVEEISALLEKAKQEAEASSNSCSTSAQ